MKLSQKVALGGMVTALSIVLMFFTGIFPFAMFALPGIAGVLLVLIVMELGRKYALVVYIGVSILSIFISVSNFLDTVCFSSNKIDCNS